MMVDTLYLASLRDGNGDLLFPSVHAGLNLNIQLLTQYHATGDTSAATALAELS